MEEYEEIEPKPLPRWVTMPLGIVLTPFTFLCVIGSSTLLLAPNVPPSALTVFLGSLFLAGSVWVFYLSLRLLFINPKGSSNFISSIALRAVALVFVVIPIMSLTFGTFWEKPVIHSIMTVAYIGIVIRLWGIAKNRAENADRAKGNHMHIDVTCKTDRFNLSTVGEDFINDCCFGEDFSTWLVSALETEGVEADLICMEDFGWANLAIYEGVSYLMCVAGNSDEVPNRPNYGTWHVMLERHRTFKDKLFGKNKTTISDPVVEKVAQVLRSAGFTDVVVEP